MNAITATELAQLQAQGQAFTLLDVRRDSARLRDGTQIAHKHGWITEVDGVIHTISDSCIVYSGAGNYVLVIFMWQPNQLIFDDANLLFAKLSQGVYNYFNLTAK